MDEIHTPQQVTLDRSQLDEFNFKGFVEYQFHALKTFFDRGLMRLAPSDCIVDIGGGCGYFAKKISELHPRVKVYETDPKSVEHCHATGVEAHLVDALDPMLVGDEKLVCFNLILHHLIGRNETETAQLQAAALMPWKRCYVFVNEYCYQSFVDHTMSGRLIWAITSSRVLSAMGKVVGRFVPSLRANTFGIGVRFRSSPEWVAFFENAGFRVVAIVDGEVEPVSLARRLLFIKSIRRDSFLLQSL